LPRPHDRNDARFKELTDYLYRVMTNPLLEITAPAPAASAAADRVAAPAVSATHARQLPHVRVGTISGMLELINDMGAPQEVAQIAARLAISVDDFLAIVDAAVLLGFVAIESGRVILTPAGAAFATAPIQASKAIFRAQVLANVPIVATIAKTLAEKTNKSMRAEFFLDLLEEHYSADEARRQFGTAVEWGRYAELFEYDAAGDRVWLSDPVLDR
jgi:NitT/TauT family transport system ATP-binding protein